METPGINTPKPPLSERKGKARAPIPRVESEDDQDVICISDSDTDHQPPAPTSSPVKQKILQRMPTPYVPVLDPFEPEVYSDEPVMLTT